MPLSESTRASSWIAGRSAGWGEHRPQIVAEDAALSYGLACADHDDPVSPGLCANCPIPGDLSTGHNDKTTIKYRAIGLFQDQRTPCSTLPFASGSRTGQGSMEPRMQFLGVRAAVLRQNLLPKPQKKHPCLPHPPYESRCSA